MKKHLREIDILKGFAIVLVMLGHSIIVYPVDLNKKYLWCNILHNYFLHPVHLPLFFAVSGFCYSFHGWKDYLSKKAKRILVPYVFFFVVSIAVNLLLGSSSLKNGSSEVSFKGIINNLLYGDTLWFLYTLFLIFLVFPFFEKCLKYLPGRIIIVSALAALQFFDFWPELLSIDKIVRYLPFFTAGHMIRRLYDRNEIHLSKEVSTAKKIAVCVIAFIEWILLAVFTRVVKNSEFYFIRNWYGILVSFVGIICLVSLASLIVNKKIACPFETLGKYSLQIFLLNGYLLTLMRYMICVILKCRNPFIIIGANLVALLGISYLIIRFVISKVSIFRFLVGMPLSENSKS